VSWARTGEELSFDLVENCDPFGHGEGAEEARRANVVPEQPLCAWVHDLDTDLLPAGAQASPVALADARSSKGRHVELGKELVQRLPELPLCQGRPRVSVWPAGAALTMKTVGKTSLTYDALHV
jgi:hypothetical protein